MALSGTPSPGETVALRSGDVVVPGLGPARVPHMVFGRAVPGTVPLRSYRLAPRKARIEIHPGAASVELFVPGYFGGSPWSIPIAGTVAADLAAYRKFADDASHADLRMTYLVTTSPLVKPTLALLFDAPRPAPPLRWIHILDNYCDLGFLETRRGQALVDGILLRTYEGRISAERPA